MFLFLFFSFLYNRSAATTAIVIFSAYRHYMHVSTSASRQTRPPPRYTLSIFFYLFRFTNQLSPATQACPHAGQRVSDHASASAGRTAFLATSADLQGEHAPSHVNASTRKQPRPPSQYHFFSICFISLTRRPIYYSRGYCQRVCMQADASLATSALPQGSKHVPSHANASLVTSACPQGRPTCPPLR